MSWRIKRALVPVMWQNVLVSGRCVIEGVEFTDRLVHPKGSPGLRVLSLDMRSLRIPLDLRGIGSTNRTGSVSLEGMKNKEI